MKIIITYTLTLLIGFSVLAQDSTLNLPSVRLRNIKGKTFDTSKIRNNGNPIIICFIKTCCSSPTSLLDDIAEDYEEWQEETGVVMYVIATDDARSTCKVAPLTNVKEWDYPVLLDPNSDFKRAMNVIVNPHTFVYNGNGKLIWQKAGYVPGEKDEIYEQLIH